jgi:hypothetical protein
MAQRQANEILVRHCVNCDEPLTGPGAVARGPDTAWHTQCLACHELVADQLELMEDQPSDAPIQIYQCRRCEAMRSCRAGWTTRCHICLDERSTGSIVTAAGHAFLNRADGNPGLARQARQFLGLAPGAAISLRGATETSSYLALAEELRRRNLPGWTIVATDVHGLPWKGMRAAYHSHGTWGRHDACGTIAKLRLGTVDCPKCGPEPGSRTHEGRRDEPYLLYLVGTRKWQKFGVGDQPRVREHARGGAEVIQVLRAPFAQVILAERTLKQRHRDVTPGRARRGMITSFGQGTEVTRRRIKINLADVLPDGEDVTSWFGRSVPTRPL